MAIIPVVLMGFGLSQKNDCDFNQKQVLRCLETDRGSSELHNSLSGERSRPARYYRKTAAILKSLECELFDNGMVGAAAINTRPAKAEINAERSQETEFRLMFLV